MKTILATPWTRYLPALAFWVVATIFLWATYQLPPAARAMPMLVGWATLALASLDLTTRTGGEFGRGLMRALNPAGLKLDADGAPKGRFALLSGLGLIVLLVGSFLLVGVLLAAPILILTALLLGNPRERLLSVVIAAGTTLGIWLIFSVLLRLHLYPGLLFGGVL